MHLPAPLLRSGRLFASVMRDMIPAGTYGNVLTDVQMDSNLPPDLGCERPPAAWYCSREPGHEGPCAARPRDWLAAVTPAPVRAGKQRATAIHWELRDAATTLREAQKAYMSDRGNNALGTVVGQCAAQLDDVLERWDATFGD